VVQVIQTQINGAVRIGGALARGADEITFSVLEVPDTLANAVGRGGVAALPGGVADAANGLIDATDFASTELIGAVRQAILDQLALFGGGVVDPRVAVTAPIPARPGPLELVVRLPLAVGIAGVDLVGAVARATLTVTRAVVTAVTDIVQAAIPVRPPTETERLTAAVEEPRPRLTLPQAIARAPVTISRGFTEAGGQLEEGVQRARTDFRNTLRGPAQERALVTASGGSGTEVRTALTAGDDTTDAGAEVTRPTRPRPVLGAVKAVTDTLTGVRDGLRTALGLPSRKPGPAAQNADDDVDTTDDAAAAGS
jgi:hypothetical protein